MTRFKNTPLFGQDSVPQHTSNVFGLAGTIIFWLLFLLLSIVIKPAPKKPKYKEVQIVLSSTPVKEKAKEAPAPAEPAAAPAPVADTPASEPVPTPAVSQPPAPKKTEPKKNVAEPKKPASQPKPAEPKKTATQPKPAPAKPKTTPSPKAVEPVKEIEYAEDPMEAFNKQVAKAPKKEFDWSQFDDEPAAETSSSASSAVKPQPVESSFSGSAGTTTQTASNQRMTSSSSSTNKVQSQEASASTSTALGKISNTTFTGKAVAGVQSQASVKAATSGSGKVMVEMTDGTQRALLEPAQPIINLSEEAAELIDGSKTVSIQLKVVESGNVPRGDIIITPAAILPEAVRLEIYNQISKWRFEAADFTSNAKFEYKIVKK